MLHLQTNYEPCCFAHPLQLPITELFRPVISYDAAKPGDKSSSPWLRAAAALLLSLSCYGLYSVGPDAATVKGNLQDARDSVLSYLVGCRRGCRA